MPTQTDKISKTGDPVKPDAERALFAGKPRAPLFHMRPLAVLAAGLLFGLLLGEGMAAFYAAAAVLCLLVVALAARRMKQTAVLLLCLGMAAGFTRIALAAPGETPLGSGVVTGRVCEPPEQRDNGDWMVYLANASLDGAEIPERLRLYAAFETAPSYGQIVQVSAEVVASGEAYRLSDRYLRVSAVAFGEENAQVLLQTPRDLYGALLNLRAGIAARISALFDNAPGVAVGMLLGDKSGIDDDTIAAFRNTGTAHLLAVSGLHVSLLAAAFSLLFRRNPWVRFVAVALFCALYCLVTVLSPPVIRASIMLSVAMLAFPLRRRLDAVSSLSAAFLLILLARPYSLWNAGFQLSFVAVLSMVLLAPLFSAPLSRLGKTASGLIGASCAVVTGTAPVTATFFGQVQFLSLVTNLFVIPAASVFLIPAFLAVALSYVWLPLGRAVAFVARGALDVILAVARYGGSLTLALPAPGAAAYLLWIAAMCFASNLCLRGKKQRALFAGVCVVASIGLWISLWMNISG